MNRKEKKEKREYISSHIDTSKSRLSDVEAESLVNFIDNYEVGYKGKSSRKEKCYDGWSSEGKFRRCVTTISSYTDDIGVEITEIYRDDDGQTGTEIKRINDARGIINHLKDK